ncbi:ricin-type beta-trefoil lectin domain protein [Streptomyces griseochromogenes]|uniref:ricin-type beta-trefoil lectin domain protein n=1 Tax=Streptomyces griseochromogenes TaxID=68214 RepID=UPI0037979C85
MFGVVGAASPAQADSTLEFRLRNVVTGKCLNYNGDNKAVTQVNCKVAKSQYWGRSGGDLITFADPLPSYTCLASPNGHEKQVTTKACYESDPRHTYWQLRTTALHQKTTVWNGVCGSLKVIAGKVTCGKRMAGDEDNWEIY